MKPSQSAPLSLHHAGPGRWLWPLLLVAAALPSVLAALGLEFYTGVLTRVLILAMAASSLNLVLGFGGLVSFGHAAFVGLGAYTVAIAADAGLTSAYIAWPLAVGVSSLAAGLVGFVSLRTRGVYFIMITLAFAQMFYFLAVSLKAYGGDDGLPLAVRSQLGLGLDLKNDSHLYAVALVLLVGVLAGLRALLNSRFGWLLQGSRENETRMAALGSPVGRVQWGAFVIAGVVAGLAGALLANLNGLVTPHMLHWSQSGQLMVMVILGGTGSLWGGLIGAAVLLGLEEGLASLTLHGQMALGAVLLGVVLWAPRGIAAWLMKVRRG
jgi:branched-chain amino acid transport system permease protein